MFEWIQSLWSEPAPKQVQVIEQREPSIEERLERILVRSRGVRAQSDSELAALIEDIDVVLSILESALDILDSSDLDQRAKRLRSKLRRTRTRAENARAA